MRLIDADAMEQRFCYGVTAESLDWVYDTQDLPEILMEMPTIDAVPVVRCRECIHNYGLSFKGEFNPDDIVCIYWDTDGLASDDFCSYGEREDGDA